MYNSPYRSAPRNRRPKSAPSGRGRGRVQPHQTSFESTDYSRQSSYRPTASTRPKSAFGRSTKKGVRKERAAFFGTEKRFSWQNTQAVDALYSTGTQQMRKSPTCAFGTAPRDAEQGARLRTACNAGPGSYKMPDSMGKQHFSNNRSNPASSFGTGNRMKRPLHENNPGPIYNIIGRTDTRGTMNAPPTYSFGCSDRPETPGSGVPGPQYKVPNYIGSQTRITKSTAKTFGKKLPGHKVGTYSPGPIYGVHSKLCKGVPAYSFGGGSNPRFKEQRPDW